MELSLLLSFIALILGGQIGLPAMLLTLAFSRRVTPRRATFVNMQIGIVMLSNALLLLFYSGDAFSGNPSFEYCRFQSALVEASGPLLGTAGFALVWETFKHVSHMGHPPKSTAERTALLVMAPWLMFLIFFVAFFHAGLAISPEAEELLIHAPLLYCRFPSNFLHGVGYFVTSAGTAGVVIVEVLIAVKLREHVAQAKEKGIILPVSYINMLLRGLIFSVYSLIMLATVFVIDHDYSSTINGAPVYFILSLMPLMSLGLFGTQRDLLRVWFACFFSSRRHDIDDALVCPDPSSFSKLKDEEKADGAEASGTLSVE